MFLEQEKLVHLRPRERLKAVFSCDVSVHPDLRFSRANTSRRILLSRDRWASFATTGVSKIQRFQPWSLQVWGVNKLDGARRISPAREGRKGSLPARSKRQTEFRHGSLLRSLFQELCTCDRSGKRMNGIADALAARFR